MRYNGGNFSMSQLQFFFTRLLLIFSLLTNTLQSPFPKSQPVSPLPESYSQTPHLTSSPNSASTESPEIKKTLPPIHILLLGLDSRKGDARPRCDAIHILTLSPSLGTIRITSVPRGTRILSEAPDQPSYISISCHLIGIPQTIPYIEKITGIHPDFVVKIGFSQALGVFRTLKLPVYDTLQFLRSRRYAIGDYQRSHNQALFIKDMITTRLEQILSLPKPIQYLLYKTIDTDLDFETAHAYLEEIVKSGEFKKPGGIELVTKPPGTPKTRDIHYETNQTAENMENDEDFLSYQASLSASLRSTVSKGKYYLDKKNYSAAYKTISTIYNQKLWLQIEDGILRDQLYFDFLSIFASSNQDKKISTSAILDFITAMEASGNTELRKQGEALLTSISENKEGSF
ncbi:LCP family protein [Candidatus Gottesmanbacteria bacterium]|nr:LCP family protein [Candidatus Gottesmanbacteria bacterium]